MNTPTDSPAAVSSAGPHRSGARTLIVWLIGVVMLSAVIAVPYALASSLRLERDTVRLRDAITGSLVDTGGWSPRVEIRVGGTLLGLARLVTRFTDAPAEVRQALRAARSAEVGVYQWHGGDVEATRRLIAAGPSTVQLSGREWTRIVSVRDGDESVAIFTPGDGDDDAGNLELCVVVLADRELIVVSVEVDPAPLSDLVQPYLKDASRELRSVAAR